MRIAVIGGGPGGLYFAALAKQLGPDHEISVWERNAADDTFGFGVVFSDETLGGIAHADPVIHDQMEREFARWDDIDVHYKGEVVTSGGHGFAALGRKRLLEILQRRCADLGVDVHFSSTAPDVEQLSGDYDLVVAADGLNSLVRTKYADQFQPTLDVRRCRYMWLGTDKVFEAFTFDILETAHGVMQMHGYPFDAHGSTFIVEMHDDVWRRAGFDAVPAHDLAPGESDEASVAAVRELFAHVLDGHEVLANNSRWVSFTTVRNERWFHDNIVLLGDAAHTAHFSIGSGTKLAMEDALSLAACLHESPDLKDALAAYEQERKAVVISTQRAAQASLEWFENLGQYTHQHPMQFAFNILTRSRRITYDNLRLRDPEFIARVDEWFAESQLEAGHGTGEACPPMFAAVPARAARPGQPGRRLTHGHVRLTGRHAQRLPLRPPRRQGTRWCRPRDDRDGLCLAPRADHPRMCRTVVRRAGHRMAAGSATSCTPRRKRESGSSSATAGRRVPRSSCGRASTNRCPRGTGRWSPPPTCPTRRASTRLRRRWTEPAWTPWSADFVSAAQRAVDGRLRPAGAPLRARLSAVGIPVPGDQPAHRRVRRRRRATGCGSPSRCSPRCARSGRPTDR